MNLNKPPAGNGQIYAVDNKHPPLTREGSSRSAHGCLGTEWDYWSRMESTTFESTPGLILYSMHHDAFLLPSASNCGQPWLVKDLEGVEVVADDFVVVGFGDSKEEA